MKVKRDFSKTIQIYPGSKAVAEPREGWLELLIAGIYHPDGDSEAFLKSSNVCDTVGKCFNLSSDQVEQLREVTGETALLAEGAEVNEPTVANIVTGSGTGNIGSSDLMVQARYQITAVSIMKRLEFTTVNKREDLVDACATKEAVALGIHKVDDHTTTIVIPHATGKETLMELDIDRPFIYRALPNGQMIGLNSRGLLPGPLQFLDFNDPACCLHWCSVLWSGASCCPIKSQLKPSECINWTVVYEPT